MTHSSLTPAGDSFSQKLSVISGLELREHEPLAKHVSMGVGGPARWFAVVDHADALEAALAAARAGAVAWLILGGGSNTIFSETGFGGLILSLGRGFKTIAVGPEPHQLTAGAGANLSAVMKSAQRAGLAGLEWAAGIPGALGGALAGNAGTPAGDTCSLAESVEVIDAQGRRLTRPRGGFGFSYRQSSLCADVILGAVLSLRPDSPDEIHSRIDAALAKRWTQPVGVRCSGCMFKNPAGDYAGRLIDLAGLKGARIGGARVAEEHANFMINDGSATAEDLCRLIGLIRQKVFEQYNVKLELEIRMVGLDSPPEFD